MDALLPAVLGALPQLGGAGLLVLVTVLLIRQNLAAAERYAADLDRTAAATAAELARVNLAHDAELAEVRAELMAQRLRNVGLNEQLDTERGLRRAAEDGGRHRTVDQEGPSPWAG